MAYVAITNDEAQHRIWAFSGAVEENMLNVGLTGGIACGKSTVAAMFAEKGAILIDFDVLVHHLQEPERPVWKAIVAAFGTSILNGDGTINRSLLAGQIFHDTAKRTLLNGIVHPAVFDEWSGKLHAMEHETPHAIFISDIPLLIEANKQDAVDVVLLVHIPPEEQVERLIRRDGYTRHDAYIRLASQMPIDEKLPYAHIVIDNRGPLEKTRRIVDAVWRDLLSMEEKKRPPKER